MYTVKQKGVKRTSLSHYLIMIIIRNIVSLFVYTRGTHKSHMCSE